MSRTGDVLRNKNKVEKSLRLRRKNEMLSLRAKSAFKAKLHDELRHVEVILQSPDVDAVIISVPDKFSYQFGSVLYTEDLAEYEIEQVDGEANKFYVRRRIVKF